MDDNIIDSLKIALELDPAKFTEGQEKLILSSKKTKDQLTKDAGELESKGAQGALFFEQMTNAALKLGSIVVGGLGIKDFIRDTTNAGNTAFYMARNIGVGVEELGRWQSAIRIVGGDAAQAAPALLGLSQALTTIQLRGKGSEDLISAFQFLGITDFIDRATGKLKTVNQLLPEIQKGFSKLTPQQAFNIGTTLGLTPDFINTLNQTDSDFNKLMKDVDAAGVRTAKQAEAAKNLTKSWGNFSNFMERVGAEFAGEIDPALSKTLDLVTQLGEALDKVGGDYLLSDIGAILGGLVGLLGGPVGVAAGIVAGGTAGALLNEELKRQKTLTPQPNNNSGVSSRVPQSNLVPGGAVIVKPSSSSKLYDGIISNIGPIIGIDPAKQSPPSTAQDKLFSMIQKLEGGKTYTKTPTGNSNDPFAYGKNQITLGTALRYDRSASESKLLNESYNDALARKIEADYYKRYNGNFDAIAIAYHNGPGAADRFVANGGSTAGIPNFGPQSAAYLERERALASISSSSNTSTSTANIGTIHVNAPNATNSKQIASSIRDELADNQLLSQANAGPQ